MKATIKDINEEVEIIYEIYRNMYCNDEELCKKLNEKNLMIYDALYEIILEMDSTLGVHSFIKFKKVFYWGLNEEEREALKKICNLANCENYYTIFCEAVKKYFDIFLDNNLKYNEIKYSRDCKDIKDRFEISKKQIISGHITEKYFYDTATYINNNRTRDYRTPSVALVVWNMLMGTNDVVKRNLNRKKESTIQYFEYTQEELDDLFVLCVPANKLDITLYSKNDREYLVNKINDDKLKSVFEIAKDVYNMYFDILMNKNVQWMNSLYDQMDMLDGFAEKHEMSERDIIDFVKLADSKGYNITKLKSEEEIEEIYKIVYPEV